MTVDYEPAPKPTPLWMLPATIAVLAIALLFVADRYTDREVGGFGGGAQPSTPTPGALIDGSSLPPVPEQLTDRFGDDVVLAERLRQVPPPVRRRCRNGYRRSDDPALRRLHGFVQSGELSTAHKGPEALTALWLAVDDAPPGYPREVAITCVGAPTEQGWRAPGRPSLDFALDGRPGLTLPVGGPAGSGADGSAGADGDAAADATAAPSTAPDEQATAGDQPLEVTEPVRTRIVQVPVGAEWAVQPRGGWWLAQDVSEASWTLVTLNDAVTDRDPLRVVFIDSTGDVVTERGVGPTRSAAAGDHSVDYELVAGSVREILDRLANGPVRACEPGNRNLCVWLSLNSLDEVLAFAAFGPHPLDTPPLGAVGYCPRAGQFQGTVTAARFAEDGSWAGGPVTRGLDRYTVRFEAGRVVVDLSEHVVGDPAEGDPVDGPSCEFRGRNARGRTG